MELATNDVMVDETLGSGFSFRRPENDNITFRAAGGEVLKLGKDGMTYKGQRVEDAGAAHRAFLEFFARSKEGAI